MAKSAFRRRYALAETPHATPQRSYVGTDRVQMLEDLTEEIFERHRSWRLAIGKPLA